MATLYVLTQEWCTKRNLTLMEISSDGRGFYVLNDDGRETFVSFKRVNV